MMRFTSGTDLEYNIAEQRLVGEIDGTQINATAVAGGRAGSKKSGVVNVFLANNPYATAVKKKGDRPGGPLPMTTYYLKTHESKPNWIRLNPKAGDGALGDRAGFAIHGRGPRGSDGCIVPSDFHIVKLLYKLVKGREKAGKPAPTLEVIAAGDLEIFERLGRELA
jgi:hypothetical protein